MTNPCVNSHTKVTEKKKDQIDEVEKFLQSDVRTMFGFPGIYF